MCSASSSTVFRLPGTQRDSGEARGYSQPGPHARNKEGPLWARNATESRLCEPGGVERRPPDRPWLLAWHTLSDFTRMFGAGLDYSVEENEHCAPLQKKRRDEKRRDETRREKRA
ncbi:hypothetical protein P4O66_000984 [Electrophorus voltai]|uniref:Uncharacterized protein n=1 Tax=Electrophorus voltai TaxID=2609070 RepID=A0AAD8ZC62_9TELE|nr:hypothetical protein P4O66_000984 [Electrophorus voltai]